MMFAHLFLASALALAAAPDRSGAPIELKEERRGIVATAAIDADRVALSGAIKLVLTVEGPGRIEVEPPRPLLSKVSAQAWRVREMGLPTVQKLDGGKTRWQQEFQLSPFVAGPEIPIALQPLKVKADGVEIPITWERSANIAVTTSITSLDLNSLRPITDIEPAPPATPIEASDAWLIACVAGGSGLFIVLVAGFVVYRRRRSRPAEPRGAAWALGELARLSGVPSDFARIADVLRLYLEDQSSVPATRLTTAELLAELQREDRLTPTIHDELRVILERCDLAKFAEGIDSSGTIGDAGDWLERARQFVTAISQTAEKPA
jgi:hypothetical protein